jgi:chemotaxis protein CheX
MISEGDIAIFIDGVKNYFLVNTGKPIEVETPYLVPMEELVLNDFTGIIGISGERKGFVCVTAPRVMLRYLVLSLGEKEAGPELIRDLIGELANTVSGNARSALGPGFMISVPLIVTGRPDRIGSRKEVHGYVIPFRWNSFPFHLLLSLE